MSLTYGDVRHWAPNIKRVVEGRIMPPWTAGSSASVKFHNDRSTSGQQ